MPFRQATVPCFVPSTEQATFSLLCPVPTSLKPVVETRLPSPVSPTSVSSYRYFFEIFYPSAIRHGPFPKQVKIPHEQMDDYISPRLSLSIHFSSFLVSSERYWISVPHSSRQYMLRGLCVCAVHRHARPLPKVLVKLNCSHPRQKTKIDTIYLYIESTQQ